MPGRVTEDRATTGEPALPGSPAGQPRRTGSHRFPYLFASLTLVRDLFGVDLEIAVKEANQKGFVLQARRWVVERSLGGYSRNRRLSKDYEHLCETSEAIVYIASIQVMLRRLRPNANDKQPYLRRKTPRAA